MHNIAQTGNGEWMTAWSGDTPWHGLGTGVSGLMTTHEALTKAHLDWKVQKRPLLYATQTGETGIVPGTYGIFREEGDELIPLTRGGKSVGKVYEPLQNVDAISFLDDLMQTQEAKVEVAGALGHGEKIWVLARLPENVILGGEDIINQFILITNSHDGSGAVRIIPTPIRVVCQNTLAIALRGSRGVGYSMRHTSMMMSRIDEARDALQLVNKDFHEWGVQADKLLHAKVGEQQVIDYMVDVLGLQYNDDGDLKTRSANILGQVMPLLDAHTNNIADMRGSAWAAYNAVTEAIDHKFTTLKSGGRSQKRMESALFGQYAAKKRKAWNKALEMMA